MVSKSQLFRIQTWKNGFWLYLIVGCSTLLSGLVISWFGVYLFLRNVSPVSLDVCLILIGLFFLVLSLGLLHRKNSTLGYASVAFIFFGLCLWFLVFLPSGALESSPTWWGAIVATLFTMPFAIAVIAYYGIWITAKKRRIDEHRRVFRMLIISVSCLLLLPFVVAGGRYINDRTGHSVGFGFTFAYRESHVGMDNNSQTFVYTTDTAPDELAKKFSSATSVTTPFSLPNILSDVGTYTTVTMTEGNHKYTVLFCSQSSPGCKSLLTKGRPLDGSLSTKKYVVTMNNDTYQFLHQFK